MAFKKKNSEINFINYKDHSEGDVLVTGRYVRQTKGKPFRPGQEDPNVYHVQAEDGKVYGLNGTAHLDTLMNTTPIGSYIRVTYDGKKAYKVGANPSHQLILEIDDERSIQMTSLSSSEMNNTQPDEAVPESNDPGPSMSSSEEPKAYDKNSLLEKYRSKVEA